MEYYKCKANYVPQIEEIKEVADGAIIENKKKPKKAKKITEHYLFDAVNYTEAETRFYELMEKKFGTAFVDLKSITKMNITELLSIEVLNDEDFDIEKIGWLEVKVFLFNIDEKGNIKKKPLTFLVQANDVKVATEAVESMLGSSAAELEYKIDKVSDPKIVSVNLKAD